MKNKTKIHLLRIFSVALGLYFLNISVNLYSIFGFPVQTVISGNTSLNVKASYLMNACTGMEDDMANTNSGARNNPPAEEEEEEEEKKPAHDEYFTLHYWHTKRSDAEYLHRFHGINNTSEFISEIVPPPPKA